MTVAALARMVKFSHSLFALPFVASAGDAARRATTTANVFELRMFEAPFLGGRRAARHRAARRPVIGGALPGAASPRPRPFPSPP